MISGQTLRWRYRAYGLVIDSAMELPELAAARTEDSDAVADVTIAVGRIADNGLPPGDPQTLNWLDHDRVWFLLDGVGQFLIENGRAITIEPVAGCDPVALRVYLLGSGFGALLFQRGYLVLHANSIRVGEHCLLSIGDSGAGKSTLAAAFLARGYDVLADDVVPVDGAGRALPGFPRIKLWQDSATRLGLSTSGLPRVLPELDKFNLPVPAGDAAHPLPVHAVYHLRARPEPGIVLEPVGGMERLQMLTENTYRFHFLQGMAQRARHFSQCRDLAGRVRMVQVTRSTQGFAIDALVDAIVADFEASLP